MMRFYGVTTAAIGVIHVVYNALWLPRVDSPFPIPTWLVWFELAWAVVSFVVVVRRRDDTQALLLAAPYVIYTALAVTYSWYLGTTRGGVTDAMIPLSWKIIALLAGIWFTVGGLRLAARPPRLMVGGS